MNNNNLRALLTPIVLALAIVLGMLISHFFPSRNRVMTSTGAYIPFSGSKLDLIVNMIQHSYVDTVDTKEIVENAIPFILKDLDPHTVYIPAKNIQRANEGIVGNFGGIGVQFYKYQDTVYVVRAVEGGPSKAAGIEDGDRIVKVNDSIVAGVKMHTDDIMGLMRGEIGTEVKISVKRLGEPQLIEKVIKRGIIPVKSLDVAYMINDTTGYLKVHTFGMNTYFEFMKALQDLSKNDLKKVIIDLRENEGGVLNGAIQMVNEFLEKDQLIVYTQGKAQPRSDYNANGKGNYQHLKVDVLINELSASASEIFAGAIQDNDRGLIIGRRSFGKGLVQEQRMLPDESALRLTVARYYTPSGRSIQKPYDQGKEKYYTDIYTRLLHGEFSEKDSINFDENLKYETIGGRTVYGGGGIMPDIFVPADTVGVTKYLTDISRANIPYEYSFEFMDKHRKQMKNLKDYKDVQNYLKKFDLVNDMAEYAARRGIKRDAKGIRDSYEIIRVRLEANIARHILDDDGFYPIIGKIDNTLAKAVEN